MGQPDPFEPRMDGTPLQQALWRIRALREGINDAMASDMSEGAREILRNAINNDGRNAADMKDAGS